MFAPTHAVPLGVVVQLHSEVWQWMGMPGILVLAEKQYSVS